MQCASAPPAPHIWIKRLRARVPFERAAFSIVFRCVPCAVRTKVRTYEVTALLVFPPCVSLCSLPPPLAASVLQTRLRRWRPSPPCSTISTRPPPPPIAANRAPPELSIPELPPTTMARHLGLAARCASDRLMCARSQIDWISWGIALTCSMPVPYL